MAKVNDNEFSTKETPAAIYDSGWVRIGNASPAFPVMRPLVRGKPITVNDTGEVQIGDYRLANSSDGTGGKPNVRIVAASSTPAPVRSR